jgi:hypothetical protein
MRALLRSCWDFVRQVSGDAAYETYLRRAGERPLTPGAFWLEGLKRRYDKPERCC